MQPDANLPARSLLDRPQRLGFLPTMWFWNDAARQRELLPIALPVVFAVVLLTQYLAAWSPILSGPLIAIGLLHPFLVMGLLERHIRKQLRLRPAEDRLASARESPPRRPLSQFVPIAMAGSAAVLLASATAGVGAALAVLTLVVGLGAAVRRRERRVFELGPGGGVRPRRSLPP